MTALEITRETAGNEMLLEAGANPIKYGQDGLPDRMVLWGRNLHFWIEWKKEKTGKLRPAQKIWRKYLTQIGDAVYVMETLDQLRDIIEVWKEIYGPASAKRILRASKPGLGPCLPASGSSNPDEARPRKNTNRIRRHS